MSTNTKMRPKAAQKPKRPTKPKPKQGVKFLPVADLHVSKLNMRHGKKAPDINDIYPSILESGIHQSLLVRKEGKGYGVSTDKVRPDWRPRWMQVPANHYLDHATCPPSASAAQAKSVMPPNPAASKAA